MSTAVSAAVATSAATDFVLSQAASATFSALSSTMVAFSITDSRRPDVFSEMSLTVSLADSAISPAFSLVKSTALSTADLATDSVVKNNLLRELKNPIIIKI